MRIEDLDAVRCPHSSGEKILALLDKLGLKSDREPIWQSERTSAYRRAAESLSQAAKLYPCFCTRAELHAAHAPRLSDGGVIYSGRCRNLSGEEIEELSRKRKPCLRIAVPNEEISFTDEVAGNVTQNLCSECGDFILRRSDGVYAYQLAVTVDDCESGVTEVVRGNDLLSSTPRQIWLLRLLGYTPPAYAHIPLVCDAFGRKLSKSEGDSAARTVAKLNKEQILGYLAYAAGIIDKLTPAALPELIKEFSWDKVKKDEIFLPKILTE